MKKLNTLCTILLILFLFINNAFSQNPPPVGQTSDLCPNIQYRYTTSGCTNIFWSASHGTVKGNDIDADGTQWALVVWDNFSNGTIQYGCDGLAANGVDVTIKVNPTPIINGPSSVALCGSGTMTLTANATINTKDYVWNLPPGFTSPITTTILPQITVTYNSTATGTIIVFGENTCGHNAESRQSPEITFTRSTLTNPTISKNSSNFAICSSESWTLTCASSQGTSFGYDWYVSYGVAGGSGVKLNGAVYTSNTLLHTSTNTATLTAPSGYGDFFANVRLGGSNGCNSGYVHFEGRAGVYNSSDFSVAGPSAMCKNSTNSFSSTYTGSDILDYKWGWGSGFNYIGGQGTNFLNVGTSSTFSGAPILLQLKNRCGYTGSPSLKFVAAASCGFMIVASPNPTTNTLTINVASEDPNAIDTDDRSIPPLQATIVNSSNQQVWSGTIDKVKHEIDVSSLPNGTYFVKLGDESNSRTQRVLIKH